MRDHGSCALSVLRSSRGDAARFVVGGGVLGEDGQRDRRAAPRAPADADAGWTEHRARGGDDLGRRAVVAPELHDADIGGSAPTGTTRRNPARYDGVGAGEPVDRLVGVADDAQVGAVAEPGAHQPELRRAGVLELVDEEVTEPPALRGRELGVAFEHVGAPDDEVVEVDEARACASRARSRRRPTPRRRAGAGVVRPASVTATS